VDEAAFREHLASRRYYDHTFGCSAVKVLPGEYFATADKELLVTVLGSCVAACIWDREQGVGGMNHFLLPETGCDDGLCSASARYGVYAMEVLVNHLLKLGARRGSLEAKVFGGGRVLASLAHSRVGERNAAFVLDYLATERIPVTARDLLDVYPRKVFFFPDTGRVMLKRLVGAGHAGLPQSEREHPGRLGAVGMAGTVELFDGDDQR
jgi:chemotaxis protein CheD